MCPGQELFIANIRKAQTWALVLQQGEAKAQAALAWESEPWGVALLLTEALILPPVPERFIGKTSSHSLFEARGMTMSPIFYFLVRVFILILCTPLWFYR